VEDEQVQVVVMVLVTSKLADDRELIKPNPGSVCFQTQAVPFQIIRCLLSMDVEE
jgi:hypothetical protein